VTVHTFLLQIAGFIPGAVNAPFLPGKVAAKVAAVAVTFQYLFALLAGYAVVIAYPFVMFTIHNG
jgi:hypothetical protein